MSETASRRLRERAARTLARLDPCTVPYPHAERVSAPFVAAFAAFAVFTVVMMVRSPYEPGQDIAYHTLCVRIATDWGKAGSPYTALYEPLHFEANTLLYMVGGLLGRLFDPVLAFRLVRGWYFLGLPAACFYGLRRLGRPPWGALLAFPLAYTQAYAAGFANFQFAAPWMVLALVTYFDFLAAPTVRRGIAVALFCVAVFLSHAHVYLWLGALFAIVTGHRLARLLTERSFREAGKRLGLAVAAGLPSLLLFAAWYARTYGAGKAVSREQLHPGIDNAFNSVWKPLEHKVNFGLAGGFSSTRDPHELGYLLAFFTVVVLALILGRGDRRASRDGARDDGVLFEICVFATFLSYFVLPDLLAEQQVALRAFDMGAWLVPFLVTPVAPSVSRVARFAVVGAIVVSSGARLDMLAKLLRGFQEQEMAGFDALVEETPRDGGVIAYAVMNPYSPRFGWEPLHQVYAMLAAKRGLEAPVYTSNRASTMPLRYKIGPPAPPTILSRRQDWVKHPRLWEQFDLVLVRSWRPTPAERAEADAVGRLIAESGEWQLWQSKLRHP